MTKTNREKYEAFIASIANKELAWRVAADAEDNCFFAGPANGPNDPRYLDALRTAEMIANDPKPYGYDIPF